MTLADTGQAIEKVSEWIRSNVQSITGVDTYVGRPEPKDNTNPRLNLFLFQAQFDPHMKNFSLDEGQLPPLWLVLNYLLTSFDEDGKTATTDAQGNLGEGLRALQQLAYLPESSFAALLPNPEPLKITFDPTDSDLLSKIMQGPDDKYHFSMNFQVRPIMISAAERPSYSLLVGVDYDVDPPDEKGEEQLGLAIFPTMGPVIGEIASQKFEANQTISVNGSFLDQEDLVLRIGTQDLAVSNQTQSSLKCDIGGNIPNGAVISAGSHPISVVKQIGGGRTRSSNLLIGHLCPTLTSATFNGPTPVNGKIAGDINMQGLLLGTAQDDIFVALYQNGRTVNVFDFPYTFAADQKTLTLEITSDEAVNPGDYLVILRVNGQQALKSFKVSITV